MDLELGGKYKIQKKIGEGAFGKVYAGKECETGDKVAIKIESAKMRHPQLLHEAKVLKVLAGKGIPEIKGYVMEGDYNVLIMTLLGPSLEKLFKA